MKPYYWRQMEIVTDEIALFNLLTPKEYTELVRYRSEVEQQLNTQKYLTAKSPQWYLWWSVRRKKARNV